MCALLLLLVEFLQTPLRVGRRLELSGCLEAKEADAWRGGYRRHTYTKRAAVVIAIMIAVYGHACAARARERHPAKHATRLSCTAICNVYDRIEL